MFDLTGHKALVTGASGGIGEAIARALHGAGATVGLHGTRREKLEELAAELGERVHVFPANLSDRDASEGAGRAADKAMDGVDILVNNAGITKDGLFVRMYDDDWDNVIEVNLTAAFRLTRGLTAPDDAPSLRPHRQHHLDRRRHRQSRPGQLLRRQGRHDRLVQVARPGNRLAQRHGQLRRARLHRQRHDRGAERQAEGRHHGRDPDAAHGRRRRRSPPPRCSWPPARPPTSPARRST